MASDYINTGEITSVRNANTGNDASGDDKDSTPDAIDNNDAGGAVEHREIPAQQPMKMMPTQKMYKFLI